MQSKKLFIINVVRIQKKKNMLSVGFPICKKLLQKAKWKIMFIISSF